MPAPSDADAVIRRLDDLEAVPAAPGLEWLPLRDAIAFTGAAANVFRAEHAGTVVIEPHDETTAGAAGHDELYVVLAGRATARLGGQSPPGAEHDAPVGTVVRVPVGVRRELVAAEPGTAVLVVGGRPGAAGPPSAWTRWTRAYALHARGDTAGGIAELVAAHRDHPGHPLIHYHLACLRTASGDLDAARRDLDAAHAGDPRTVAWAADDEDLAPLRHS
jgi:quercetin dioxygenase-like cupin family protein